jgi:SSS family solute:Na+ symporter
VTLCGGTPIEWPAKCPLNGMQIAFIAALSASLAYVVTSLMTCRQPFDLDRLLHRGAYADADSPPRHDPGRWKLFGMGPEFTPGDRFIYLFKLCWALFWFAIFVVGTIAALVWCLSDTFWARYWLFKMGLTAVLGIGTTIWFLIGGFRDLADLFRTLRKARRDTADDGTVTHQT